MLTPEQVTAVAAVLAKRAISLKEARDGDYWSLGWSTGNQGWSFDLRADDTVITANAREKRSTAEEALADAVDLRGRLVEAAGGRQARGFVAADTINDRDLAVVAWVGTVKLVIATDR